MLPLGLNAALTNGRSMAEARMVSRVTVHRSTGRTPQNETTGEEAPGWATVYTNLPFRLVGGASHAVTIGGVEFEEATARGDMPASTTNLADGDLIEVTAGEWAGSVFRIVEAVKGDQRTARRVPITEAVRPEGWS